MSQSPPTSTPTRWRDLAAPAAVLSTGVFLYAVCAFLATTTLPSITADIGGLSLYAWTTSLFLLTAVLGSTLAAPLLSRTGSRTAYRVAAAVFVAGTVLCALAPSMPVLLAGRAVQGLGGGIMFALSYTLIRLVFPRQMWPKAMALVSAMWGVATIVGPATGGLFAELDAWRFAFWVFVPVALVFAAGVQVLPSEADRPSAIAVPWRGVGLIGVGVLAISGASVAESAVINAAGMVAGVLALLAWLHGERVAEAGLLPRSAFTGDRRMGWVYATAALLVIGTSVEVFVPYFGQGLQGLGPLEAGYLGAAMSAGWTAASMAFSGRTGAASRRVVRAAPGLSLAGLVLLVFAGPVTGGSVATIAPIATGLFLLGAGVGAGWPHLLSGVLAMAEDRDAEIAGTSITTVQMVATAFGAALAGLVTNAAGFAGGTMGDLETSALWLFLAFVAAPALALFSARRATTTDDPGLIQRKEPAHADDHRSSPRTRSRQAGGRPVAR